MKIADSKNWNTSSHVSSGSPTVIKEAIAAKLPFISVDVGDVKKWADLVEFGVVVSDRDPTTIADSAINLLDRIEKRTLLCNEKCLEKMDITSLAKRIRCLYDQVRRFKGKSTDLGY